MKAQYLAAQFVHGRFKTQSGTGGGLIEEGCQLFVAALLPVGLRMGDDVLCFFNEFVDLLHGQVRDVNQISFHGLTTPF